MCVVAVYVWYLCADKILMDDFSDENLRFSKMETVLQMYFQMKISDFQNVLSFNKKKMDSLINKNILFL